MTGPEEHPVWCDAPHIGSAHQSQTVWVVDAPVTICAFIEHDDHKSTTPLILVEFACGHATFMAQLAAADAEALRATLGGLLVRIGGVPAAGSAGVDALRMRAAEMAVRAQEGIDDEAVDERLVLETVIDGLVAIAGGGL